MKEVLRAMKEEFIDTMRWYRVIYVLFIIMMSVSIISTGILSLIIIFVNTNAPADEIILMLITTVVSWLVTWYLKTYFKILVDRYMDRY